MATYESADDNAAATPVACSLTAADLAVQARRWLGLAARAMTGRARTAHGIRISFRPGPGAEEELRSLAAVERECCPWAAWTVEASAGQLVLDVRSAGDGIATLHGMFTGLPSAPVPKAGPARGWPPDTYADRGWGAGDGTGGNHSAASGSCGGGDGLGRCHASRLLM